MKRFWMRSLTGQWIALMLLALVFSQLLFFFIYREEQGRTVLELRRDDFLARSASVARLVSTASPSLHPEILPAANTTSVRYWLEKQPPGEPAEWQKTARERLLESPRPPAVEDLPLQSTSHWVRLRPEDWSGARPARLLDLGSWNGFGLAIPLDNGDWLHAVYAKPYAITGPPWYYYASLGLTAVLLSLVSVMAARRVGRPLQRLTESAERLGRGEEVPLVPEEGADDIRRTAAAFNRMQSRLRRFLEDRTRMMAAISHDLRTPITSMRLQAEFVADAETRDKLVATLDDMKAITEATLAFAREEAATEPTRTVDMQALVESLGDDLAHLGWDVSAAEGEPLAWRCRPDAVRRALRNVIENAVRYGNRARMKVTASPGALDVDVEDEGPGIAPEDHERVFAPFVRLESSRNRSTGGTGLGLAIARTIVRAHGGDILLANRDGGGLRTTLHFPRDEKTDRR